MKRPEGGPSYFSSKRTRAWLFGSLAFVLVALAVRYVAIEPPRRVVIATGAEDSYFTRVARMYGERLAKQGVTLDIVTTDGAVDNVDRIDAPGSTIDVAFVHGGLTDAARSPKLASLGSVAYDPLWIVYRASLGEIDDLPKLRGRRIDIGSSGSGTEALARRVLEASGVTEASSTFVIEPAAHAARAVDLADATDGTDAPRSGLLAGTIDAAFIMGPPDDPKVHALFAERDLRIMNMTEAEGLSRHLGFLHALRVPKGTVDLALELPDRDLSIVASTITLLARKDVHPALLYILMSIVDEVHEPPGLLHKENDFPSDKDVDLPLSPEAEAYYKNGKPILQRYLPFALASAVERLLKVLVPVILLLLPAARVFPAFNLWRVKRKLARSYRELLDIEGRVQKDGTISAQAAADYDRQLLAIEEHAHATRVPLIYSNELYILREHVDLARRHVAAAIERRSREPEPT